MDSLAPPIVSVKQRNREWLYISAVLGSFVITPELRRIFEYVAGGFQAVDVLSSVSLFMLVPVACVVIRRWRSISTSPMMVVVTIWIAACSYGLIIGWIHLELLPGIFGFAIFVLPLAVALWILSLREPVQETFRRFTGILVIYGAIAGVYGVLQFVTAPPWDTAWMQQIKADSFGDPVPFQIRVFGPLNSPQTNALFLTAVLIFSFTSLNFRRWWAIPATSAMALSLILSMARTAWIELLVGLAVVIVLSPSRGRALASVGLICGVAVLALIGFLAFFPGADEAFNLSQRLDTFTSLSEDGSAIQRSESASLAMETALANPAGLGIGTMGEAQKLGSPGLMIYYHVPAVAIDEGYLTRLVELGVVGFVGFLSAVIISLFFSIDAYFKSRKALKTDIAIIATCIAMQVGTLFALLGGDTIQALTGLLYFVSVVLPLCVVREQGSIAIEPSRRKGATWLRDLPSAR